MTNFNLRLAIVNLNATVVQFNCVFQVIWIAFLPDNANLCSLLDFNIAKRNFSGTLVIIFVHIIDY